MVKVLMSKRPDVPPMLHPTLASSFAGVPRFPLWGGGGYGGGTQEQGLRGMDPTQAAGEKVLG